MSDIFVSYASADRERARMLADALVRRGWSVWWDRTIPAGKEFDQVIEEALDSARCVVVLWSRTSTTSSWVKTEAADAMRRKILVPALIDDTKIPLEFRRLQAADLSDWDGQEPHGELEHLCRSIQANISGRREPVPPPLPRQHAARPKPVASERPVDPAPTPAPANSRARMILVGAGAAILVAALTGFVVSEYSKRVALEERFENQLRLRAGQEQGTGERTPREQPARQTGEDRQAEEGRPARAARETEVEQERKIPDTRQEGLPARRSIDVEWNDASLTFAGTLTWNRADGSLRFRAFDTLTGTPLGEFSFPAGPPTRGSDYTISGVVPVARDSTTPYPHQHTVHLSFDVEGGVPRLIENCQAPGTCFPAR